VTSLGLVLGAWLLGLSGGNLSAQEKKAKPKAHRLPSTNLKEPILWGSSAEAPEGFALSFGGEDQTSEDGQAPTRIKKDGKWVSISADLRKQNPLSAVEDEIREEARRLADLTAQLRRMYFQGATKHQGPEAPKIDLKSIAGKLKKVGESPYAVRQAGVAADKLERAAVQVSQVVEEAGKAGQVNPAWLKALGEAAIQVQQAAEALSAEPPPRALSPLVYEPKTKLFVLSPAIISTI
jgi:hypothetical protein